MDKVGNLLNSKYGWEFTVEGNSNSRFPIDMLRYDRAYPADSDASRSIKNCPSIQRKETSGLTMYRVIKLRTTKGTITPARWNSFAWTIKEAFELTKEGTPKSKPSYKFF